MSEQSVDERSAATEVATHADIVEFVHGLGGPVIVTAYNAEGDPVGYLMAVDIDDNEVEVHLADGAGAVRLVAVPEPPEED